MSESARDIRDKAQALLARREHSRGELERKLEARGFGETLIAQTLDELEARNLLSDRRFTERFVAERAERGHGPVKIRHALRERGVDDALAAEHIEACADEWHRRARAARVKRFGAEPPAGMAERARQMRFLHQRGFESEHIRYAMRGEGEPELEP